MASINPRASVRAVVREVTAGTIVAPGAASDFIPLRPGKSMASTPEKLTNDELINNIGMSKPAVGKESIELSHPAYFKSSEVVATAPDPALLYESAFGAVTTASTEYDTVAGSTTTTINVNTGEGATFSVGEALMIRSEVNGYDIRNIKSISSDTLTLNFAVDSAAATGTLLGKSVLYTASSTGHPSLSVWDYHGNGDSIEACAGVRVSGMDLTLDANAQAEVEFKMSGTSYYLNPIEISSSTEALDWSDTSGTYSIFVDVKMYKSAIELADAIELAMNESLSTGTFVVEWVESSGKFKFTASGVAAFSLLWNSGANTASSIATKIGFTTGANSTGALTYTATNALTYAAGYTPSYDNASNIVIKNCELLIGDQDSSACLCASSLSISLANTIEDVDCICAESGVQEKQITSREVTMTATISLAKYQLEILDNVRKNKSISAMVNIGPKTGGDWIPGKCVNVYLGNCVVSAAPISGETILTAELTINGFVTSTVGDLYLNFV